MTNDGNIFAVARQKLPLLMEADVNSAPWFFSLRPKEIIYLPVSVALAISFFSVAKSNFILSNTVLPRIYSISMNHVKSSFAFNIYSMNVNNHTNLQFCSILLKMLIEWIKKSHLSGKFL